jgi:hypothetical protein
MESGSPVWNSHPGGTAGRRVATPVRDDPYESIPWDAVGEILATQPDAPPSLGFGPHTDTASRRAAKAAGLTRIVSNGQFHTDMAQLIERYRRK